MLRRTFLGLGIAVVCLVGVSQAADKQDPTGTWKWTINVQNKDYEVKVKLKLDGDKLTGTMTRRDNTEVDIENATFKDNEVTFTVSREQNGQKTSATYKGKVDGDTITGKMQFKRNGEDQSREWEAKREKK